MPPKHCRHATQALRLPDFRRALRHHNALACELCTKPPVRGNSRARTGASKRDRRSPNSPETASDSTNSSTNSAVETLNGWSPNDAWEDLYVCISCGHMACLGKNHLLLHFQLHPKHFVGFHVGTRTFWCCVCKQEIDGSKSKIQVMMNECNAVFEEIASKQVRRVRTKLMTNPTLSPEDDDILDSQRSYVYDGSESSSRGADIDDLTRRMEATTTADGTDIDPADTAMERPRSITFGTDQSRALERQNRQQAAKMPAQEPETPPRPDRSPSPPQPPTLPSKRARAPSVLGFSNLGNTCYFNSATQALLTALHYFPAFIYEDAIINRLSDSPVSATLLMLKGTIENKTRNLPPLSPERDTNADAGRRNMGGKKKSVIPVLTVAPLLKEMRKKFGQFRGNYQQDAHELFTSLLWAIDEEIDPPPVASNTSNANDNKPQEPPELVNVFVKTDTGETISLRVSPDATKEEIHALLAKKLALDDLDVFLQPSGSRQTLSRRSSSARVAPPTFSKVNFVRTLFGGALITEVRCRSCGNCSETVEDAFQLSLPIPTVTTGKYITVKECLQQFTAESQLLVEAENGYDCEKCSRPPKNGSTKSPRVPPVLRDATMRLRISELPRVLVLHLKRLGRQRKITQHIQFDAMLDMAPHVEGDVLARHESTLYELIAVVVHKGNKRAGHYVAYVSRKKLESMRDDEAPVGDEDDDVFTKTTRSTMWTLDDPDHDWFYVSDSLVQSVPFDQVLKCEAYMLFYQKVAPAAPSPIPRHTDMSERETETRSTEILRESSIWI